MSVEWVSAGHAPVVPGTKAHASALTPLGLFIVHFSWVNFGLCVIVAVGVVFLTLKGRPFSWYWRRNLSKLRQGRLSAWPQYIRRRMLWTQSWSSIPTDHLRR